MPTRGPSDLLDEALASIRAQTIDDWECVVVVDGGDPDCPPPLPTDERVRVVVRRNNGGAGAARNTGIEHSSGANLTFLDDDDTWLPERLELADEALERAPVGVCFGMAGDQVSWVGEWEGRVADTILERKAPSVNGLAVRRDALVPFDPAFRGAEDVEWLLRLAHVAPFATVPRPGFVRRLTDTAGSESRARVEGIRRLLDKHDDYFSSHPRSAARCWAYYGEMAARSGLRLRALGAYGHAMHHRPSRQLLRNGARALLPRRNGG